MEELTAIIALSKLKGIDCIKKKWLTEKTGSITSLFEGKAKIFDENLKESIITFKDHWEMYDMALKGLKRRLSGEEKGKRQTREFSGAVNLSKRFLRKQRKGSAAN